MFRLYDFACVSCEVVTGRLVDVPQGAPVPLHVSEPCENCGCMDHDRRLSMPAPYMGEKVCNPKIRGGKYDTMGNRKPPPLPQLPEQVEHNAKTTAALKAQPVEAHAEIMRDMAKSAPTEDAYRQHFAKPEYAEVERKRAKIHRENKEKQRRANAWRQGATINMKRDKCAGDAPL